MYLLATAYHRANQTYRAYHMLKGLAGAQSRYLFAVCCMQLGKHTEAEAALMPDNDISRVPNGAAGHYLLGRIYQLSNRHSAALSFYDGAMNLDPMMWSAFEELCVLGGERKAHSYFAPGGGAAPSFARVGGFGSEASGNAATPAFQPAPAALQQSAGPVPMSTGPTKAVGLNSGAGPAWAEASGLHTKVGESVRLRSAGHTACMHLKRCPPALAPLAAGRGSDASARHVQHAHAGRAGLRAACRAKAARRPGPARGLGQHGVAAAAGRRRRRRGQHLWAWVWVWWRPPAQVPGRGEDAQGEGGQGDRSAHLLC